MFNRKWAMTICAVVAAGPLMAGSIHGQVMSPSRVNYLTFSKPVVLPGVVLPAGTYTFEAGPDGRSRDIVLVTSRDGKRHTYLGFTRDVQRPEGIPADQLVGFGEAPAKEPLPIAVWYPVGSTRGHEFLYR